MTLTLTLALTTRCAARDERRSRSAEKMAEHIPTTNDSHERVGVRHQSEMRFCLSLRGRGTGSPTSN